MMAARLTAVLLAADMLGLLAVLLTLEIGVQVLSAVGTAAMGSHRRAAPVV